MSLFPLFEAEDPLPPQAARLAPKLRAWADRGVYFGTSSWKYEGWLGSIYTPERYMTRGKFSQAEVRGRNAWRNMPKTFPVGLRRFQRSISFPSPEYWQTAL